MNFILTYQIIDINIYVIIISMSWLYLIINNNLIIVAFIFNEFKNLVWFLNRVLKGLQKKLLLDKRFFKSGDDCVKRLSSIFVKKTIGESYSKWYIRQLVQYIWFLLLK